MAPFARWKVGPEWFTRPHPKSSSDPQVEEHTIMWEAFLTPRIMPLRFKSSKTHLSLIAYQPNLVSRQFGIIQTLPSPIFPREKSMLYFCNDYTEDAATKHIGRYAGRTVLSLFDYQLNFLCYHPSKSGGKVTMLKSSSTRRTSWTNFRSLLFLSWTK